jgi:peptidoglycan/xylan/chitin deacetylase (PgdA/CDA1 family)
MLIELSGADARLLDAENFRELSIAFTEAVTPERRSVALSSLGSIVDERHVSVEPDRILALAGAKSNDPRWRSSFDAMLAYAASHGWVDDAGRVRIHVEAEPSPTLPPAGSSRTIVLTFDNLGEATELERGTFTSEQPLGRHPSVTIALPRLLDELDRLDLHATFFVEAINCEFNPEAVTEIVSRGHELGIHGWRHELWKTLHPDRERELLERSQQAFAQLGHPATAFRPPGGEMTTATPALLRKVGCRWASPHGSGFRADADGFAWAPFEWDLVDAYYRMESFAGLREARGHGSDPFPTELAEKRLRSALTDARPLHTLILHAFLMLDDAWWQSTRRLLRMVAELRSAGNTWVTNGSGLTDRIAADR